MTDTSVDAFLLSPEVVVHSPTTAVCERHAADGTRIEVEVRLAHDAGTILKGGSGIGHLDQMPRSGVINLYVQYKLYGYQIKGDE